MIYFYSIFCLTIPFIYLKKKKKKNNKNKNTNSLFNKKLLKHITITYKLFFYNNKIWYIFINILLDNSIYLFKKKKKKKLSIINQ